MKHKLAALTLITLVISLAFTVPAVMGQGADFEMTLTRRIGGPTSADISWVLEGGLPPGMEGLDMGNYVPSVGLTFSSAWQGITSFVGGLFSAIGALDGSVASTGGGMESCVSSILMIIEVIYMILSVSQGAPPDASKMLGDAVGSMYDEVNPGMEGLNLGDLGPEPPESFNPFQAAVAIKHCVDYFSKFRDGASGMHEAVEFVSHNSNYDKDIIRCTEGSGDCIEMIKERIKNAQDTLRKYTDATKPETPRKGPSENKEPGPPDGTWFFVSQVNIFDEQVRTNKLYGDILGEVRFWSYDGKSVYILGPDDELLHEIPSGSYAAENLKFFFTLGSEKYSVRLNTPEGYKKFGITYVESYAHEVVSSVLAELGVVGPGGIVPSPAEIGYKLLARVSDIDTSIEIAKSQNLLDVEKYLKNLKAARAGGNPHGKWSVTTEFTVLEVDSMDPSQVNTVLEKKLVSTLRISPLDSEGRFKGKLCPTLKCYQLDGEMHEDLLFAKANNVLINSEKGQIEANVRIILKLVDNDGDKLYDSIVPIKIHGLDTSNTFGDAYLGGRRFIIDSLTTGERVAPETPQP